MREVMLPEKLEGNWVWLQEPTSEMNKYCYFRHDLYLDESPRTAEIWLAAHTTVHLFINGRHIYFGRGSQNQDKTYVHNLDISYCLQPGNNLIGISVHNNNVPQYSTYRHKTGGMWCQLDLNGKTILSTDQRWYVQSADCLHSPNLRFSSKNGFCEQLDFNKVSKSWVKSSDFIIDGWKRPDVMIPIEEFRPHLAENVISSMICPETEFKSFAAHGTFTHKDYSNGVEYSSIMNSSGTYMAESYLYSEVPETMNFSFFSDTPYKLFLNGKEVKSNLTNVVENGSTRDQANCHCNPLHDFGAPKGSFHLKQGWNRLTVVQQLHISSYGFTLNLDANPTHLVLMREPDEDGLPGWKIAGPLRVPLSRATGNIELPKLTQDNFCLLRPIDSSAYYESLHFEPSDVPPELPLINFDIKHREYVVLDFEKTVYGLPQLSVTGSKGDILDIVCGEELIDGHVPSFSKNRIRSVETIILDGKKDPWIDFNPKGFRYMMIIGREVKTTITVDLCNAKSVHYEYQEKGLFESSDKLLTEIWENSVRNLAATLNFNFMDGANRENSQYITDSYIQAMAALVIRGDYNSSAKALREFAAIQYETGEMPAMHPDEVCFHLMDFSLMYPTWLKDHYQWTGDANLAKSLLANVIRLFEYIADFRAPNQEVLFLDANQGSSDCYLDYSDIDRRGVITGLNSLYVKALTDAADLLADLEPESELIAVYLNRASIVTRTLRQLCWDSNKAMFSDCWTSEGLSSKASWQTNVLALYGGIANDEQAEKIISKLFTDHAPFETYVDNHYSTPFFRYFVWDALSQRGMRPQALNIIRQYWGGMLKQDIRTWPELYNPLNQSAPFGGCMAMGNSVSPATFIMREVAGIYPAKPGFTKIYFSPMIESFDSFKAHLPTPNGNINVIWEKREGQSPYLSVEASNQLTLIPLFDTNVFEEIEFHISDTITIEASESTVI